MARAGHHQHVFWLYPEMVDDEIRDDLVVAGHYALDSRDNVANPLARKFYEEHGVTEMATAYEVKRPAGESVVMTTRYCLRRELGCCLKDRSVSPERRNRYAGPLTITTGPNRFRLDFDCANCEMNLVKE